MVKKPVLTLMALLHLLGDRRCVVSGTEDADAPVGLIATRRDDSQVAVLVYHSRDRFYADGVASIELHLKNLPFDAAMLAHYRIDERHSNPFDAWETYGAKRHPHAPDEVYRTMRQQQEPTLLAPVRQVTGEAVTLEFTLPLPAVSLILLSAKPENAPAPATRLRLTHYDGLIEPGLMIAWDAPPDSRMIHTYEVGYSPTQDGPFERVNPTDTFCTAYLHGSPPAAGWYRVRAVDYWGRTSDSEPIIIGG